MLSGRSLEPFGNGRPRQMITQRHNPAYRSACVFKNRIVSYNVIFNLRRFSTAGFSQVFYIIGNYSVMFLLHKNVPIPGLKGVFPLSNML